MLISLPNFAFLTVNSPSDTQRLVSQENAFKKSKHPGKEQRLNSI